MKARIQEILAKIDALSLRERALVLFSVLAVVYLIWDVFIFDPLAVAKGKVDSELMATAQKITVMEKEEAAIKNAVNADPDRDLKDQLAALRQRMDELENTLSELSLGLVPVQKLTQILQEVLQKTGSLELESLRTLPVEEVQLSVKSQAETALSQSSAGVFKHGAQIIVRGSFMDLLQYLDALESMNWRFYWEELRFEQLAYPEAVISIKVYTLTTDAGLFGVKE